MTPIEVTLGIALALACALLIQAHKNHTTFALQAQADLAQAKADVSKDIAALQTKVAVLEHRAPGAPAAAVVSPAPAAAT